MPTLSQDQIDEVEHKMAALVAENTELRNKPCANCVKLERETRRMLMAFESIQRGAGDMLNAERRAGPVAAPKTMPPTMSPPST